MKITRNSAMIASLCMASVPLLAAGQDHAGHHPPTASTPAAPVIDAFATYDTNKDGKLSKAELAKHPRAAHAAMVDADKDGAIDRKEFAALQKM